MLTYLEIGLYPSRSKFIGYCLGPLLLCSQSVRLHCLQLRKHKGIHQKPGHLYQDGNGKKGHCRRTRIEVIKGSMQESSGDYVKQTLDVIFKVVCEVRCASKNRHHRRQDVFKSEWITCSESMWPQFGLPIHAKLRDINLHNVTYSLISRNPKKWMFVVQISLLIVTFLSLVPQNFVNNVNYQRSQPTPSHCGRSIFFFCHLLTVGACVRHIAQEGQVEWITLAEWMGERTQIVLTTPLCYSIVSHATLILWYHASMLTLQELCNIMCILSRICVILRSLECRSISNYLHVYLLRRSGCKAKGVPFGSIHLNKQ